MPKSTMSMQSTQSSDKKIKRSHGPLMGKKDNTTPPIDLSAILELPVPKKPCTAYSMFVKERLIDIHKTKDEDDKQKVTAHMKVCGEEWKALTKQDQEKYEQLALKDKERYQNQSDELQKKGFFTFADGQQSNHVVPKIIKFLEHVVQPKKPSSAYFHFQNQARKEILQQNPDLKITEAAKRIGELWSKVDDSERSKFEKIAAKDKIRYDNEFNDLLTLGYFTMPDGSKSSDHQRIVKKKRELRNDQDQDMNVNEDKAKSSKSKEKKANAEQQSPRKSPNDQNSQKVQKSKSKDKNLVDEKQKSKSKKNVNESPSKSLKGKSVDRNESPDSKKKMSPSKDQKALKSQTRKPSPEKSMKNANLSKSSQKDRNPRSKREESPDAKKVRQTPQTKPNVKKVVSPPQVEKDKKIQKSSRSKREESPEKTTQPKKSRTPLQKN